MSHCELPIPDHFDPNKVSEIWRVPYQQRAEEAKKWAEKYNIKPSKNDKFRICLLAIDVQNTFCIPGFELFVAGHSGKDAVQDNQRLSEFIYRNLALINQICVTMDTHQVIQIFHSIFFINDEGKHPSPLTLISEDDIEKGIWKFNSKLSLTSDIDEDYVRSHILHYTKTLKEKGKYELTIWPYHSMLGGIGHALVSALEEAIFFHSIARYSQPNIQIKGRNPFTEHYSVFGAEVKEGPEGEKIARKNCELIEYLLRFDAIFIAGQAKSHCVAWTVDDMLKEFLERDEKLVEKVYLLEDCTSPVVIPDIVDYTEEANKAFQKFAGAGMHIVQSTDNINNLPGIEIEKEA